MALVAVSARANLIEDLSHEQKQEIKNGGIVMLEEEVPDKPWPRVRIYKEIKATPEEVAAVFFDYDQAKTYIPDVLESKISKRITPCIAEVDYAVDVPILPDEAYTARNQMQAQGGTYRISWNLLHALQTKGAEGNLLVEPHGNGISVIRYTNLVTPSSGMAKILRSLAMTRMQKTVMAIAQKVESQKANHSAELAEQIARLRRALAESTEADTQKH